MNYEKLVDELYFVASGVKSERRRNLLIDAAKAIEDLTKMVPPCKVGDTVYMTDGIRIYESTIRNVVYDTATISFDMRAIGDTVFLNYEDALKEAQG